MEVLLAIAMIAAVAGFAGMYAGLFSERALKSRPPERIFLSALKLAQIESAARGRNVSLAYEKDGCFFIFDAQDKSAISKVWLSPELEEAAQNKTPDYGIEIPVADVVVAFIPKHPKIVGTATISFPDENLKELTLSPDGSMTPAKASLSVGGEEPIVFDIDPFCAAPLEEKYAR